MWLAQAYEPDRLGRVRLSSFWCPRPMCNPASSPWVLVQGVNKQTNDHIAFTSGEQWVLIQNRNKGQNKLATSNKIIGGQWCHHSRAWKSGLSEAVHSLSSFPLLLTYPGFYSAKVTHVSLGNGNSKVMPWGPPCIQVQSHVTPCDTCCHREISGEIQKFRRGKLPSLGDQGRLHR